MDPNVHTFKRVSWFPIVQVVVLCMGTFLSFIIGYGMGHVSMYMPFISENGAKVPEMCIFSLTLIFGSFFGCVAICHRHFILRYLLVNEVQRLKRLNNIDAILGLVSMAGLAGVAAFPVSTVFWAHLFCAGLHFTFALMYVILLNFINHYVPGANALLNKVRSVMCLLLLLFMTLLVIFFPVSYFKWNQVNTHPPAIKTPDDKAFGVVFASSFLEWIMYGTFLIFMFTLSLEFREFHFVVGVVAAPVKREPET